jgi:hypothetical protein
MSYQEEDDIPSSVCSHSDIHPLPTPEQKAKRIQIRERCKVWNFVDVVQVEVSGGESGDLQHNTTSVRRQINDRLQIERPSHVNSITIFCESSLLSGFSGGISLSVTGYVQFSTAYTSASMQKWIPTAEWKPVKDGLAQHTEFKQNMQRSENIVDPWIRLAVNGEIGLCNQARASAKEEKKVCGYDDHCGCTSSLQSPHRNFTIHSRFSLNLFLLYNKTGRPPRGGGSKARREATGGATGALRCN